MRRAKALAGALLGVFVVVAAASPALAHPDEDAPQRIEASATGTTLHLVWSADQDDRAALLERLGLVSTTRTYVYENGAFVAGESDLGDDEILVAAPGEVGGYLLEHIEVRSGGVLCDGSRVDTSAAATTGVVLDFECAAPVSTAEIGVWTLTDIDPAYAAAAVVGTVPVARWGGDVETIVFAFGPDGAAVSAAPGRGFDPTVPISIGVIALLLGVTAVVLIRRRRSTRSG